MTPKSGIFLTALLRRYHAGDEAALTHFLSPSDQKFLKQMHLPKQIDISELLSSTQWAKEMHYSWFLPVLQQFPREVQPLYIALFSKEKQTKLQERLLTKSASNTIPSFLYPLLLQTLKKKVIPKEVLSSLEIPFSPLNAILQLSTGELLLLIDLLGIHDLSAMIRQVVDRALLGKIHEALSQQQLLFLHYCLKQPLKWIPTKLNFAKWNGDKKVLQKVIHKLGLARLAKALSDEHKDLRFHLCHHLDTGRASIFNEECTAKFDPSLIPYFKSQVMHLLKRFQK